MNRFLTPNLEGERPEPPKRVYMRIDQLDAGRALLEVVTASFIEENPGLAAFADWALVADQAPIFVLDMPDHFSRLGWWWRSGYPAVTSVEEDEDPLWLSAELRRGTVAELYPNLFQAPISVDLVKLDVASNSVQAHLNQIFDLAPLERTEQEIQARLDRITNLIDWVGVYDVGQGGANGACDYGERPLAYFDLGGGVLANRQSWPTAMSDFCYAADPPVVLSHWDWDHWSSGTRFKGAQGLDWIVPVQTMGSVHATFAATLHAAQRLWVWPTATPHIRSGQMTVSKCLGRGQGRNHTGLAMEIKGPGNKPPILLPGDARYSAVPGALASAYTALVAPHHGADMKTRSVPTCHQHAGARVAYSFGASNTFAHPRAITEADHQRAGWAHKSQGGAPAIDRQTAQRTSKGLGHIGLGWTSSRAPRGHRCGSPPCAVAFQQT